MSNDNKLQVISEKSASEFYPHIKEMLTKLGSDRAFNNTLEKREKTAEEVSVYDVKNRFIDFFYESLPVDQKDLFVHALSELLYMQQVDCAKKAIRFSNSMVDKMLR